MTRAAYFRRRIKRTLARRRGAAVLILTGLILGVLAFITSSALQSLPLNWMSLIISGCMLFGLAVWFFFLGPVVGINLVRVHELLKSRVFEKALDPSSFHILEMCLTAVLLNSALLTLGYLLPFRELLVSVAPPLQTIQSLLPNSLADVIQGNFLLFFLPVSFGPALIYTVRWFREKGSERGGTMFEVLQILVYIAVGVAILAWWNQRSLSGSSLIFYSNLLFVITLPGSIGGVGLFALIETSGRKLPYVT
jgi:hypothetical protein